MGIKKELFIHAIKMIEVEGRTTVPSVVLFNSSENFIGFQAIEQATDITSLNENFKLNLGEVARGRLDPPMFETGDGKQRSANAITQAFIERLVKHTQSWVSSAGLAPSTRVLVAEPLTLDGQEGVSKDWLANYRYRISSILSPFFKEVDFLPEPFAVFQFYRYGFRHPLVAENRKHVALVIDFGGGTFDVSVVDTTMSGDVSASGRNSRPLAAASLPIGGSLINIQIARELIGQNLEKRADRNRLDKAWQTYRTGAVSVGGYGSLAADLQNFVRNVKRVIRQVEQAKIHICQTIADWSLDAKYEPVPAAQIVVPTDPFALAPAVVEVRFGALQLRDIFVKKFWQDKLRGAVQSAISRSSEELDSRPISLVLLSGGSANIGWLAASIEADLRNQLHNAEIIELRGSFQEIVAQGLAVECARRTYNEGTSDFQAVTYNRLCLVVGADGESAVSPRFKQLSSAAALNSVSDGTLLHSAHAIGGSIGKPLRWKFRLPSPPKHRLDYYFLKSSLDYNDLSSLLNIDHTVFTRERTSFESQIEVELTVDENGSAHPRFIYRHAHAGAAEISVTGAPFFMDMTSAAPTTAGEAYVGLDFGTSNSSVSYVERGAVQVFTQRANEAGWRELNDLASSLPYPAANPIAKFLAGTTSTQLMAAFPDAFESSLYFLTVLAYLDFCTNKGGRQTSIFKSFSKASAGPIWSMLRTIVDTKTKGGDFLPMISRALNASARTQIDEAIDVINDFKHHRIPKAIDFHRVLGMLGNALGRALDGWHFGSFESVSKRGFSRKYSGLLRLAKGSHAPFVEVLDYVGVDVFSEQEAVLVNPSKSITLRLLPFFIWTARDHHGNCTVAMLDSTDVARSKYRCVDYGSEQVFEGGSEFSELHDMCRAISTMDQALPGHRCEQVEVNARSISALGRG